MNSIGLLIATVVALAAPEAAAAAQRSLRIIETLQPPAEKSPPAPTKPAVPAAPAKTLARDNQAGLKVELVSGADYAVGEKLILRASAERPGYLILADVDASGKVTQIFPNVWELEGDLDGVNRLQARKARTIPGEGPGAGFDLTADFPLGVGMIVGLFSDKPVQIIDLPDVPSEMIGKPEALDFLHASARTLKLLPASDNGPIEDARFALVAAFYSIRK